MKALAPSGSETLARKNSPGKGDESCSVLRKSHLLWRLLDEHGGIFRLQSNPWDRTNVEGKVQLEKNLPTDRVVLPSPLFWPLLLRFLYHLSKLEEGMYEDIVCLVGSLLQKTLFCLIFAAKQSSAAIGPALGNPAL